MPHPCVSMCPDYQTDSDGFLCHALVVADLLIWALAFILLASKSGVWA